MSNLEIAIAVNTTRQEESFMAKNSRNQHKKKDEINVIVPIDEKLTSRAGLGLYAGYFRSIELFPMTDRLFSTMRKNRKSIAINELFVQILSFFMDGTAAISPVSISLSLTDVMPRFSVLIGWLRFMPSNDSLAVSSSGGCSGETA